MPKRQYWIVGPGRVGRSIGALLEADGDATVAYWGSGDPLARPEPGTRVLLTVPDAAIRDVAAALAACGRPSGSCVTLHFSGVEPLEDLEPLAKAGYAVGGLHPLAAVADADRGAERLRGVFFGFEGEAEARAAALEIVEAAEGQLLELAPGQRTRYHAACVFAANYVVTCAAVAVRLLTEAAGVDEREAARALAPLWKGAVGNLDDPGLPRALTGPIVRGDEETVKKHLEVLDGPTAELYRGLALEALRVARQAGLEERAAARIEAVLENLASDPAG